MEKKGLGDKWSTTLGTKARRKKERKTSNNKTILVWALQNWRASWETGRNGWMKLQLMEFEFARYKQANKQCKCDFCVLLMAEAAMQSGFFFSLSFRPDSVGESLAQCFCRVKWHSANWFLRASLHFFRNFSNSKISKLPAGISHRLTAILPLYYLQRTTKLRV